MHGIDIHDLSDDADYAASIQQGSASMNRSDSSKQSSSGEQEGAEIVYLKDNVAIHPTQYASERISGRLKLIKQGGSLFMRCKGMSGHIDLDAILRDAEALCICAGENGESCIPPGTPPSLPLDDASMYYQQDDDDVL